TKPGTQSYPRLKIHLSLTKKTYYVGEPIAVTPEIHGWPPSAPKYSGPSFFRDAGLHGGFDLLPDVLNSSGELVAAGGSFDRDFGGYRDRRQRAEPSSAIWNMMLNGFVPSRTGSVYAIGRPAKVFIHQPGIFKLAIPETVVHVKSSTGPLNAVSADA